jgi:malate dehydrogenase (oxaloacetate-decarboxylating)(NADP+)
MLYRDCQRQVNQDRNVFAACMVACGDADAMVSGVTRNSFDVLDEVTRVIAVQPDGVMFGLTILLGRERPLLLADTLVHETPSPAQLAEIAVQAAAKARVFGLAPRVALLSYANFGNPTGPDCERVRQAVALLAARRPDFEFDGEMSPDVALDTRLMRQLYPFCRLGEAANILVMPGLNSANITAKLLPHVGGGTVVGPLLIGLTHSVQIVNTGTTVSDLVNLAALAAHDAIR